MAYAKNIRLEYGKYSDAEYKNGRHNVIKNFLEKKRIYQTDDFYNKLVQTARKNLKQEKELFLSGSLL